MIDSFSRRIGWLLLLLPVACATPVTPRPEIESRALVEERNIQRSIALEQNVRDSSRIQDVSFPLLVAAAPLCENRTSLSIGLDVATGFDFEESFQHTAREALGLSAEVSVLNAAADGPAFRAGIQARDVIVAVNDNPLVDGTNASTIYNNLLREELTVSDSLKITVRRDQAIQDFRVTPVLVCDYQVELVLRDELNAFADGDAVFLTRRMLRFTDDDKELALVIAHELAHNIMDHIPKRQQNYWVGAVIDIAANTQGVDTDGFFSDMTSRAYSHEFEAEADYVGMYILARTGTDLDGASYFWRRMAIESPGNIDSHSLSHPATAERFLALEAAILEINEKKAAGSPLNPELIK
ncbi:MAG: M48 family metallopeptidase [Proteobacteria bacterium]|nr:M48 family metallopeptidase [Pseudomonadota bacterium]